MIFSLQAHAFSWRSRLDLTFIRHVQDICRSPMQALGYVAVENAQQRDDEEGFEVVDKTREEVWPEWKKYGRKQQQLP